MNWYRVRPRAMRNDGDIVSRRLRRDLQDALSAHSTHITSGCSTSMVRSRSAAGNRSGYILLARRPLEGRMRLLQEPEPSISSGAALFPPVGLEVSRSSRRARSRRAVQRRAAIDHQREIRPHQLALRGEEIRCSSSPSSPSKMAMRQRHLAPRSQFLYRIRR